MSGLYRSFGAHIHISIFVLLTLGQGYFGPQSEQPGAHQHHHQQQQLQQR